MFRLAPLLVLVACASNPEPSRPGELKSIEELPATHAELWRAWREQVPDWEARREAALRDADLTRFLVDNLVLDLLAGFQSADFSRPDDPRNSRFERAQAELVSIGEPATWALAELNAIGNGYGATVGGETLVLIGRPAIPAVLEQLARPDRMARGRAAGTLGELPHARRDEPGVRAALEAGLRADPEWAVRKRCAEALAWRATRDTTTEPARAALSRALADPDEAVRRAAAGGLLLIRDPRAVPALINYLERCERGADLRGHDAAIEALRGLSGLRRGEQGPQDALAWRAYWKAERDRILPAADPER